MYVLTTTLAAANERQAKHSKLAINDLSALYSTRQQCAAAVKQISFSSRLGAYFPSYLRMYGGRPLRIYKGAPRPGIIRNCPNTSELRIRHPAQPPPLHNRYHSCCFRTLPHVISQKWNPHKMKTYIKQL